VTDEREGNGTEMPPEDGQQAVGRDEGAEARTDALRRSTRLLFLSGIVSGLAGVVAVPFVGAEQFMLASDVYLAAADALLAGEHIYEAAPPDRPTFHFIYPPVIVFAFVPHALLGTEAAAYVLQTVLNVGAAAGIAVVLRRALSRRGIRLTRVDFGLLFGFAFLSAYSAIAVINGQVTLWLALAFVVGFDALDRSRETLAGTAFAAAALVKVFPAGIGLWLVRRRAWRAAGAALVVGCGGLLVGVLALGPDLTVTYFTEVLTGRYEGFDGAPDPTQTRDGAQRQIAALTGLGAPVLTPLAFLVLAPIVAVLYRDVATDERRQAAILGTLLATLLFFPLQRLYTSLLLFPLIVLLYRLEAGRARTLLLVGALVSFVRVDFPLVEMALTSAPLPTSVEAGLLAVFEAFFRVILPPTLGLWLLLAACVLVHRTSSYQ